ncbi:hypothetical protein HOF67_02065 [Candidatus Peregrinibacteria bacterium]|nr:hypothetical protein [Candidatus Peregrinibacteria bacterium]
MPKHTKLLAIILISIVSLTGCFGGDDETPTEDPTAGNSDYSTYETTDFTLLAAKDWEVLTKDNFTSNVPPSTAVVIRNNIKSSIFTANLNVSQAQLTKDTTSKDFALQTLNTEKYNLVGFQELVREELNMPIGETSLSTFLTTFRGRKTVTEPILEFKQLYIAQNGYGIIVTAAYLTNEDESVVNKLDPMIRSFQLK